MDEIEPILQRARRRTAWVATVGVGVGAIAGLMLVLATDRGIAGILTVVGFACAVGGIAGALSLLITISRYLSDLQRPLVGLDRATRRAVNRSIRSATPIPQSDGELAFRAADRARGLALLLPYQAAQLLLLYVGIGGPQLPQLMSDDAWQFWFSRVFLGAILITGGLFVLFARRTVAAARRYLRAVSDVDASAAEEPAHPVP